MKYELTKFQVDAQKAIDTTKKSLLLKSIRSGKTLMMLDYIHSRGYKKVLWLVPDSNIRDKALVEEITKWKFRNLSIQALCYNSLKKFEKTKWDLVVLDEVQKLTPNYYKSLALIHYDKLVAMTGTIPNKKEKKELLFDILGLNLVYQFTTDMAVIEKIVAPYKINIIKEPLSNIDNVLIKYKKNNKEFSFYTSEKKRYYYLSEKIDITMGASRKMMLALERMRFLNTLDSKIYFIKRYLKENNSKRLLIFVATREMAEKISEYVYHGTTTSKYYDMFAKKQINHLILVEKGGVGHTYLDLDGCLLATINSSNTIIQQKIFRTILFRDNYIANIDILVSKDTIQEKWLEKSLYDLNNLNIK